MSLLLCVCIEIGDSRRDVFSIVVFTKYHFNKINNIFTERQMSITVIDKDKG